MPFAIGETIGGLNHLCVRWQRRLFRQPVTRHISLGAARGLPVSVVLDANGVPRTCHICGFAIARLDLTGGWAVETCSAVGLDNLAGNRRFQQWTSDLARTPDQTRTASQPGLHSSGLHPQQADSSVNSSSSLPGKLV